MFGGYNTYLADRYADELRLVPAGTAAGRERLDLLNFWPVSDEKIGFDYKAEAHFSTARCCRPTRRISSGTARSVEAEKPTLYDALRYPAPPASWRTRFPGGVPATAC